MASLTGSNIGKYRIMERLGRGGMADVYKGYHPRLDRYVAVKILHPNLIEGEDFLKRFEREAKTVASLRHPNIVQVFDFDIEDDIYYMVMEFINGGSLKQKLCEHANNNELLPQQEVNTIFQQVADALGYAHNNGMLHRDVKPSNILLDDHGKAYLTDFGIAKIVSGTTQLTSTGTLIGTPAYMSPEQCKGIEVSTPSDIYSLGVVLYEMIVGNVPFDADTPLAVLHKHLYEPLPLPSTSRNDISDSMECVILKALAKEPEDRFKDALSMLNAFNQSLEKEPINNGNSRHIITEGPVTDKNANKFQVQEDTIIEKEEDIELANTVAMETDLDNHIHSESNITTNKITGKQKNNTKWVLISGSVLIIIILTVIFLLIFPKNIYSDQTQAINDPDIVKQSEVTDEIPVDEMLCPSIEECLHRANELRNTDEFDPALEHYYFALSLVPEEEHPAFAFIFCEIAEYGLENDELQFAIDHFQGCIDWTEEDVDLQEMRNYAMDSINHIENLLRE